MTTQRGEGAGEDVDWFARPAGPVTPGDEWVAPAGRVPEMRVEPVLPEALFTESVLPDARQPWDPFGETAPAEPEGPEPEVTVVAAVGVVDGVPVAMVDGAAVAVVDGVPTVSAAAGGHADAVAAAAAEGLGAAPRLTAASTPDAPPVAPPDGARPVPPRDGAGSDGARPFGGIDGASPFSGPDGAGSFGGLADAPGRPFLDGAGADRAAPPSVDGWGGPPAPREAEAGAGRDVGRPGHRPAAFLEGGPLERGPGGPPEADGRAVGLHRHAPGETRGPGDGGFDPADSGTWRIAHVVPGAGGGRRTTVVVRYLLGLLAADRVRVLTRWTFAVPVLGALLLLVRPRWIGAAILVLGILLVLARFAATALLAHGSLPHRFRPVEDDLRAAVEGGKSNLRGELDRVGATGTLALVRLARGSAHSDVKAVLRGIEIDRVLPRAQLERALKVLDLAPPPR